MCTIVPMEQSEKKQILEEVRTVIHREVGPVLDILMEYLDVRFDEVDERFLFLFGGISELLKKIEEGDDEGAEPID